MALPDLFRPYLHDYTTYAYLRIPLQGVLLVEFNSHFGRKNRLPQAIFEPMTVFWPELHLVAITKVMLSLVATVGRHKLRQRSIGSRTSR